MARIVTRAQIAAPDYQWQPGDLLEDELVETPAVKSPKSARAKPAPRTKFDFEPADETISDPEFWEEIL